MTPHLPCPEPSLSHCDHDDDSEVEVLQVGFRGVSLLGMSGLLEGSPGGTRLLQFATALSPGQNAVLRAGFCSVSGHVGAFNWVVRACRSPVRHVETGSNTRSPRLVPHLWPPIGRPAGLAGPFPLRTPHPLRSRSDKKLLPRRESWRVHLPASPDLTWVFSPYLAHRYLFRFVCCRCF